MLVLSRLVGQRLIINGNIKVKIIEVRGNKVCLGIDAPTDVIIHREEIHERIIQETQEEDKK